MSVVRPNEAALHKYKDAQMELMNYAPEQILNTPQALKRNENFKSVCCFFFQDDRIFTGYEDGLICIWDNNKEGRLIMPLIGHTNRVN
mmetsp:Transcript_15844/g.24377  ORF Transcript_15844/g.24377 Transcript_15844/m.24377 type:complete len:88 (+) Transcript_15844:198-461(+)